MPHFYARFSPGIYRFCKNGHRYIKKTDLERAWLEVMKEHKHGDQIEACPMCRADWEDPDNTTVKKKGN